MRRLCGMMDLGRPFTLLAVRIIVGGLFVYHGIDKLDAGISMVEGMFSSWGVPAPGFTAPLTAIIEIGAGLALIAGIGTRLAAMVLGAVLLGAIVFVKADIGIISSEPMPGAELDLAYLAGLATLVAFGPGRLSADAMVGLDGTGHVATDADAVPARRRSIAASH